MTKGCRINKKKKKKYDNIIIYRVCWKNLQSVHPHPPPYSMCEKFKKCNKYTVFIHYMKKTWEKSEGKLNMLSGEYEEDLKIFEI